MKKTILFLMLLLVALVYSGCSSAKPAKEVKPDFYEAQKVDVTNTQIARFETTFYLRVFDNAKNPIKEVPFKTLAELQELLPKIEKERGVTYSEGDVRVMYQFVKSYTE